ncbi:MAG: molybdopterin molybdotransferase MoeA [Aureispira sp.]
MIGVEEAKMLVAGLKPVLRSQRLELAAAVGSVLAQDIHAPLALPPFDQSAMDGYALCLGAEERYHLLGEVAAGSDWNPTLKPGQAVRIFTGAPIPSDANAVIQQEKVELDGDDILVPKAIAIGLNIRPKGEQIEKGALALRTGMVIQPATVGFIASLGITEVVVFCPPKVGVVVTGSELVAPGKNLQLGQIYESNGQMLQAVLKQTGFGNVQVQVVEDDYLATLAVLQGQLQEVDVLLISGGISVGDYDFVGQALPHLGVETLFYKVRQKPGKPLYLGTKDNCIVFALPGNPAAALSCYYEYVLTALKKCQGHAHYSLQRSHLPLASAYQRKGVRAQFLKAFASSTKVELLEQQSSAMLHSFAAANALVYVQETVNQLEAGDLVEVHWLPQ